MVNIIGDQALTTKRRSRMLLHYFHKELFTPSSLLHTNLKSSLLGKNSFALKVLSERNIYIAYNQKQLDPMHKMRIRTVQSIMLFLIVVVYSNRLLSGAREDENIQSTIDEENRSTKLSPQLWQEGVKLVDVNTDQQVLFSQKDDSNVIDSSHEFSDYLASNLRDSPYPGVENYTRYTIAQSKIKPLIDDIINNVTWFQYPIRTPACRESTHPASVFVAIISAASYFDKRKSIRNTWLRDMLTMTEDKQMDLIGYAFILGQTDNEEDQERIRKESEEFGDILQIGMKDDYYNLTLKMVGLLNWLNTNCHQANFVLKVDDDVYVNVRNLIKVVKSLDPSVKGAYGSEMGGSPLRCNY